MKPLETDSRPQGDPQVAEDLIRRESEWSDLTFDPSHHFTPANFASLDSNFVGLPSKVSFNWRWCTRKGGSHTGCYRVLTIEDDEVAELNSQNPHAKLAVSDISPGEGFIDGVERFYFNWRNFEVNSGSTQRVVTMENKLGELVNKKKTSVKPSDLHWKEKFEDEFNFNWRYYVDNMGVQYAVITLEE